jgi:amino acid transporter
MPQWIQMDYLTASNGFKEATALMSGGKSFENLSDGLQMAYTAYTTSPTIGSLHFIADLPALLIIVIITALVYRGMKESRNASNLMVVVKLCIILLVIAVGIFHIDTNNWHPFAPNGVGGILKGVSAVFFAYIGFDAISTTAEECKDPQRDLPRGMMWAIIICTICTISSSLFSVVVSLTNNFLKLFNNSFSKLICSFVTNACSGFSVIVVVIFISFSFL